MMNEKEVSTLALQLMKIHVLLDSVTTSLNPNVTSFFHVTAADVEPTNTLTIETNQFFSDDGLEATELPELTEDNSYYQVYVNGVLQMTELSTYTPGAVGVGSLTISVTEDSTTLLEGTPIVLKVVNFEPASEGEIET